MLIFALIGFVAFILGVLAFVPIPEGNRDMFIQAGAAIIGILTLVAGYYWGKSRPSQGDRP
ncbi:putative membrane protein [Asticcacaulis biprosthecium C19]|uniref:Putative membrane protein n=1 Tax=Asticcacaulis biprosthecium C19 TaxID=715226 RepID=F4QH08_9CAUL|nr:putative membrane protein [Asticcacaulis biprosthecium C19]